MITENSLINDIIPDGYEFVDYSYASNEVIIRTKKKYVNFENMVNTFRLENNLNLNISTWNFHSKLGLLKKVCDSFSFNDFEFIELQKKTNFRI